MRPFLLILALAGSALAQPPHSVALTWTDAANPAGTTYSIYRGSGTCASSPTFVRITSALAVKTYTDTAVVSGHYCYRVTATLNSVESLPSPEVLAQVPTFPPATLTVVVQ